MRNLPRSLPLPPSRCLPLHPTPPPPPPPLSRRSQVQLLWEVIHELPLELKKKFLFFSTGSDRVPIKGLGNLNFVISRNGTDESRLPSAHTCFNHLLLPEYQSKEKLLAQLMKAISDTEGFHII